MFGQLDSHLKKIKIGSIPHTFCQNKFLMDQRFVNHKSNRCYGRQN